MNRFVAYLQFEFWFQLLVILVPSYFYSKAILVSLAYAAREEHRVTPLSPCVFFLRKFKWLGLGFATFLIPWVVVVLDISFYLDVGRLLRGNRGFWEGLCEGFGGSYFFYYGSCFGQIAFLSAVITFVAPRFASAWALALIGTLVGIIPEVCLAFLVRAMSIPVGDFYYREIVFYAGHSIFAITCLYIYFVLDRKWFRFDS